MFTVLSLIGIPLVAALMLLIIRHDKLRSGIIYVASAIIAAMSVVLLFQYFKLDIAYFNIDAHIIDKVFFFAEIAIGLLIVFLGIKYKKFGVVALSVVQMAIMFLFEIKYGHSLAPEHNLFVDRLSIIMALIIGIIGSLICVYAVGYMREFHLTHHPEMKDKRGLFFFIVFLFLSAMFGLVFANNLLWLFFFWEITTLSSFILIGYKGSKESINNSFRALLMNLLGGVAFAAAIFYLFKTQGIIELDKLTWIGSTTPMLVSIPVILIAFAGITKAAQMPFSSWLLGAMVAPTPVSALLHSSTMVKAGVYILLKLSVVLTGTTTGYCIAIIGGVTFLITSFIAVSQSDAKKVLAYSTIANLGLIVLCAGIGTTEAVWAGILLLIFHAISKCLLFLCVGVVEHKVGSRNIESMDSLVAKMPHLAVIMLIGMAGMFLAPFGMLISKWAVLVAIVHVNPVLAGLIAFGSAATLFYWVKWMGKILFVMGDNANFENTVSKSKWFSLYALAGLTIAVCAFFPLVSSVLIQPYIFSVFGEAFSMSEGNLIIMSLMMGLVLLFPLTFINYSKKVKLVPAYLAGANLKKDDEFVGAMNVTKKLELRNYYLEEFFGEHRLFGMGVAITLVVLIVMFSSVIL
ncbi:MAG: hypothetical protein M0Q46_06100 [Endomicrobiales bacterium]|nr:hypothetical protein [Endomicrobiales bacterium]